MNILETKYSAIKTIYDLYMELTMWINVSQELRDKAKSSNITSGNNRELKSLLNHWHRGAYDENPQDVIQEIEWIITNQ